MSRGNVLVIGASGLVGSALVPAFLARGWQVTATLRESGAGAGLEDALEGASVAVVRDAGDAAEVRSAIERAQAHLVVNCVSTNPRSGEDATRAYVEGNVVPVAVMLDTCVRLGVPRAIVFGSGSEYKPEARPLSERDEIGPRTVYDSTKVAASVIARRFRQSGEIEVSIARPFSLYGPRERLSRFVPYVVTSALAGRAIEISSGSQRRDYLYVDDIADGIVRLAEAPAPLPEAVNFSGPVEHSLLDFAVAAVETVGSSAKVIPNSRPGNSGDRTVFLGDSSLARDALGWVPGHDLRAGLAKTVEWYRANPRIWESRDSAAS
jgi:nucleoside-diphosphate-sugar epimerase